MKATLAEPATSADMSADSRRHLFYETSHSPALADLVGYEKAQEIIDFCFIANPYYPTPAMLEDLQRNLPNLIKSYPSSNPVLSQQHLAAVLNVDPEHLIIGNGATELIALIKLTLIDRIAVPIPTFGEYIEKMKDLRDAELYALRPEDRYQLNLDDYLAWVDKRKLGCLLVINPGNPTGQFIPLEEMVDFLHRARHLELVIVDESFIDFAGDTIPSLLSMADQFTNLLIVRSMSKHCGVPGLRLGYCYSSNLYLLNRLRRFIPTWNLNTLAQYFLSQLPDNDVVYHESRRRLIGDVTALYEDLSTLPHLDVYPTGANFLLFKIQNGMTANELQTRLLVDHEMYVRDCSNKLGMDQFHIRVASQGREKDKRLVHALRTLLQ
ncbi:pyridoxal phosphate-dependent aminotransferase [Granulicella aggregans]|uniref:pyridoxal phosphate-dependent aminotransferase n=1 Tax=Granulicella aggregans TaxID=474949 RepID=UPI0021DF4A13|nr:histidinol-phosphate transaminase [Granulicella aggregans]